MKKYLLLSLVFIFSFIVSQAQKSTKSIFKNSSSPKDTLEVIDLKGNLVAFQVSNSKPATTTALFKDTLEISDMKGNYYFKIGNKDSKVDNFKHWCDSVSALIH